MTVIELESVQEHKKIARRTIGAKAVQVVANIVEI